MNDGPILVTYATRAGSTAGVAEAIGQALRKAGLQVEVRPMQAVTAVAPYRAVVAGSAINGNEWLPEAMQFVKTHQADLARKPFAAFLTCMTVAMRDGDKYRPAVAQWLEPVRRQVEPVSEGLFAGALDLNRVASWSDRLKFRLAIGLGFWPEGDQRDWAAIRAWARSLKPILAPSQDHAV